MVEVEQLVVGARLGGKAARGRVFVLGHLAHVNGARKHAIIPVAGVVRAEDMRGDVHTNLVPGVAAVAVGIGGVDGRAVNVATEPLAERARHRDAQHPRLRAFHIARAPPRIVGGSERLVGGKRRVEREIPAGERESVSVVGRVLRAGGGVVAGVVAPGRLHDLHRHLVGRDGRVRLVGSGGRAVARHARHLAENLRVHDRDARSVELGLGAARENVGELDGIEVAVTVVQRLKTRRVILVVLERAVVLPPQHTAMIAQRGIAGTVFVPPLVGIAPGKVLAGRLIGGRAVGVAPARRRAVGDRDHLRGRREPRFLEVHARLRPDNGRVRAPLRRQTQRLSVGAQIAAQRASRPRIRDQFVVVAIETAVVALGVPPRGITVDELHRARQVVGNGERGARGTHRRVARPLHVVRRAHVGVKVRAAEAVGAVERVGARVPTALVSVLVGRLAGNERERAVEHLPPIGVLHARGRKARLVQERVHIHERRAVVHRRGPHARARGGVAASRERVHVDASRVVVVAGRVSVGMPVLTHAREIRGLRARRARPRLPHVLEHLGEAVHSGGHIEPQLDGVAHLHAHGAVVGQIDRRHLGAPIGHDRAGPLAAVVGVDDPLDAEQCETGRLGGGLRVHVVEGLAVAVGGIALGSHVVVHGAAHITRHLRRIVFGHAGHLQLHTVGARVENVLAEYVFPPEVRFEAIG